MSKNRILASLISNDTSKVKPVYTDSDSIVTSASLGVTAAAGTTIYSSADTLPVSANAGDQAFVSSTNRLYIFNGSGWYNIALINSTPYWITEADGSYTLSTKGDVTTITMLAQDSDGINVVYTAITDSDFDGIATIIKDSENGRTFTIIPIDSDNGTAIAGTGTVTFRASDGVNLVSTLSTFTIVFQISNSNYTTLLVKADTTGTDNQVDASTIERTLTEAGNITSTAFTPYHPGGYSTYFDGTSNANIQVKGEPTLAVGTGNFSFSCWYKSDGALDGRVLASSIATAVSGVASQLYWNVSVTSAGALWLQTRSSANSGLQYFGKSATGLITANTWHHIAAARINGVHYCAVDGVEDTSVTQNTAYMNITTQELAIGLSNITGYESYGKGYIRDFNFCVGGVEYDLSAGNYTVPDEPITPHANTKVLIANRPYIKDTSATPLTLDTIGSAVKTVRVGPYDYFAYAKAKYGGSVYFDGTGDYITTPADTTHLTMSGDFTIDFWIYPTSAYVNEYIYGKWNNNSDGWAIFTTTDWSSGNFGSLTFYYGNYGSNESATSIRTEKIKQNQWSHCRITRDNNVFYMAINGVVGARSNHGANGLSWSDTRTFNANTTIGIGGNTAGYSQGPGYMAELRVINGTALSTTDFTPPTAPVTAVTNTKLLTCTNKNDIWEQGSGTVLTKAGNTTASNTQRKFTSSSAMYFDGTGDYLYTGYNDLLALGTGDFTVECWVNKLDTNHRGIWQITSASAGIDVNFATTLGFVWRNSPAEWQIYAGGTNVDGSSSFALSTNTWYHAAVVRSSGTTKLYIDGTEEISTSDTQNYTGTYMAIGGAYTTSYLHNGYIQDVRVTKGLARYTSNFTPPTSEFDG